MTIKKDMLVTVVAGVFLGTILYNIAEPSLSKLINSGFQGQPYEDM